jgi:uncharacterized membrane protein YhiD involved in acid resistance
VVYFYLDSSRGGIISRIGATLSAGAVTAGIPAVVTQPTKVVAAVVAGVGRLAAAVVEIAVDGKAT